jgi:hypothetical protein
MKNNATVPREELQLRSHIVLHLQTIIVRIYGPHLTIRQPEIISEQNAYQSCFERNGSKPSARTSMKPSAKL